MAEPAAEPERPRPFRVALLAFCVEHFGCVHEQHELASDERSPLSGMGGDEIKRAIRPITRDLRRRQRSSGGVLGELRRILPLVFRSAASEAQRHVGAVGVRIVADEEVRSELRGREVEAAADSVVPDRDGQQHDRQAHDEHAGELQSRCESIGHHVTLFCALCTSDCRSVRL